MEIHLVSISEKNLITNKQFAPDSFFNPIQDLTDNWIISKEEVMQCNNEYKWVKNLPKSIYFPKSSPDYSKSKG